MWRSKKKGPYLTFTDRGERGPQEEGELIRNELMAGI
jgi:hypothetical protein